MPTSIRWLVVGAVAGLLGSGCASQVVADWRFPASVQLDETVRRQVQTVRVQVRDAAGLVQVEQAARGGVDGMKRGAAAGALAPIVTVPGWGFFYSPVTAVIGAVAGAISADSAQRVEAEEKAVGAVVQDAGLAALVGAAIARHLRERTTVVVDDGSHASAGPALEVQALDVRLGGVGVVNLDLFLSATIETTASGEGQPTRIHRVLWRGPARARAEWLAADSAALRAEIAAAADALAERIVDDLFLVTSIGG